MAQVARLLSFAQNFSFSLLDVDSRVAVDDLAVDFVEEVDGVVDGAVEDVAAAVELLGHHAQVPRQSRAVVAKNYSFVFCS